MNFILTVIFDIEFAGTLEQRPATSHFFVDESDVKITQKIIGQVLHNALMNSIKEIAKEYNHLAVVRVSSHCITKI